MSSGDRRRTLVLGLPAFGMALAITAVSTYLPVLVRQQQASTVVIGTIIGAEGLMALWVPVLVGDRSDRLRTRVDGRLPFVIVGGPVMAVSLCVVGLISSVVVIGVVIGLFFIGYFMAYTPYRALYPDLVDDEIAGRSQSVQAASRGVGTGLALLGGGLLLALADFLPFVVAAATPSGRSGRAAAGAGRRVPSAMSGRCCTSDAACGYTCSPTPSGS
jgi:Na+/melibiose symporter-like transporter